VEEVNFKFRQQVVRLKLTSNTLDFIYRRIQGTSYEDDDSNETDVGTRIEKIQKQTLEEE
jgi:hypothetical protein